MPIIVLICFAVLICLGLLGEATLPLFNGDAVLAARVYKSIFACFGFIGFACLQPIVWPAFARKLQQVIALGGSTSSVADYITSDRFLAMVSRAAKIICVLFIMIGFAITYMIWQQAIVG